MIEAAQELAAILLGRDEVRLARKVLEGGPLVVARAVDLAEMVLDRDGAVDLGARTVR